VKALAIDIDGSILSETTAGGVAGAVAGRLPAGTLPR
jgi:hypothetical protein